jgi:hypothetical protein
VSGDAELPALSVTRRREFLGRHKLGEIRRLVERPLGLLLKRRTGVSETYIGLRISLDAESRGRNGRFSGLGSRWLGAAIGR